MTKTPDASGVPDWALGKAAALLRTLDGSDQDVVRVALAMEDVSLGTRGRAVAEIRRAIMRATDGIGPGT